MRRAAGRAAPGLGEAALFTAWALLLIWPVTPHLTERAVGSGDSQYWLWLGWRLARLLEAGRLPTTVPDVMWPYGSHLVVADGPLPSAVVTLWNLVAPPVPAFNLAVLTAVVTGALAARHLASLFTRRRTVQLVAGLAFAAAPVLAVRLEGHYNLLFAFPAPLLVALMVRVARDEQRVPPLGLGLLLALAYASSGYYLFFGAVAVAVGVACSHTAWPDRGRDLLRLAAAAGIAVVVLSPFLVPKLRLEQREAAAGARPISAGAEDFSADVVSAFVPPAGQRAGLAGLERLHAGLGRNALEVTSFPGLLPLLGLAGVVVVGGRLRRPLLAAAAALWLLGLGPTARIAGGVPLPGVTWLPMGFLLRLPGMAGVRAPNRAGFTLLAVATAALALSLAWAFERLRPAPRALLAAACAVALVAGTRPVGWSTEPGGPEVAAALDDARRTARPGQALIHLPDDCLDNAHLVSLQIRHRLPLVGCQGFDAAIPWRSGLRRYFESRGWAALRCHAEGIGSRPASLPPGFDARPDAEAVGWLRSELDVRFVVFDRAAGCPGRSEAILAALQGSGRTLGDDGRLVVVDLVP